MNVTQIQNALASTDDQIKTQIAQLEKTNEIQNVAMHDGEMQVAEEQMWTKIQLQERLIDLIKDKFRLIGKCEDENAPFKKIYEVQKAANQETSQMKDAKPRMQLIVLRHLATARSRMAMMRPSPEAVQAAEAAHREAIERDLKVMDATAFALARENRMPIIVFSIRQKGAIEAVVRGEGRSTVVCS